MCNDSGLLPSGLQLRKNAMSTLRYTAWAKAIKNKPKVNEDPKDALLKQYEDEIKNLKAMLEAMLINGWMLKR